MAYFRKKNDQRHLSTWCGRHVVALVFLILFLGQYIRVSTSSWSQRSPQTRSENQPLLSTDLGSREPIAVEVAPQTAFEDAPVAENRPEIQSVFSGSPRITPGREPADKYYLGVCNDDCLPLRDEILRVNTVGMDSGERTSFNCVHFLPGNRFCDSFPFAPEDALPGTDSYYIWMLSFFKDVAAHLPANATGFLSFRPSDGIRFVSDEDMNLAWNMNVPVAAHNIHKDRPKQFIFIPDPHFIQTSGFQRLVEFPGSLTPYKERRKMVFWRGSSTRQGCINRTGIVAGSEEEWKRCTAIPRVQMVSMMKSVSHVDSLITRALTCCETLEKRLTEAGWMGPIIPEQEWSLNRGIVEIDGLVNAWGNGWRTVSGSVLFKVESPYVNHFTSMQRPWVHFVPIKEDLSDLEEQTKIVLSDEPGDIERMSKIARAARDLQVSMTYGSEVRRVASELLDFWDKHGNSISV